MAGYERYRKLNFNRRRVATCQFLPDGPVVKVEEELYSSSVEETYGTVRQQKWPFRVIRQLVFLAIFWRN